MTWPTRSAIATAPRSHFLIRLLELWTKTVSYEPLLRLVNLLSCLNLIFYRGIGAVDFPRIRRSYSEARALKVHEEITLWTWSRVAITVTARRKLLWSSNGMWELIIIVDDLKCANVDANFMESRCAVVNGLVMHALSIFALWHIVKPFAVKEWVVFLRSLFQRNVFGRFVRVHVVTINFDFMPSNIDFMFAIGSCSFVMLNAFAWACFPPKLIRSDEERNERIDLTIWWCTASLSRCWLLLFWTIVGCCVLVTIPASDASLLMSSTSTVLPLSKAPTTMIFTCALFILDRASFGAFARRVDVTVGTCDVASWVASSTTARTLYRRNFFKASTNNQETLSYLLPRSNNPSEGMKTWRFALADFPRLWFIFRHCQVWTEFRIDLRSILDRMRILSWSWIESHTNRLFDAHASSACRRALRSCGKVSFKLKHHSGMRTNRSLENVPQLNLFSHEGSEGWKSN